MEKISKPKTRNEVMLSIVTKENQITEKMHSLYSYCPEFSMDWLKGLEANYNSFLDYCSCAIKAHQENKKSK
jgi:hypothetical protein